jgi:hypothetical protein
MRASWRIEETLQVVGSGQHTLRVTAEEAIAVQRNALVKPVAQRSRQQPGERGEFPGHPECSDNPNEGRGARIEARPVEQHHGVVVSGGQPVLREQRLPLRRLHSTEAEYAAGIEADQETRPGVAEFADAVEKHDALVCSRGGW